MSKETIDLRSDTVTKPTQEMREAMKEAEVGDDVMKEDPTLNRLENMAAEKLGKESALFVTSGTQGNITSLLTHTSPGEEVILGKNSHIYKYEVGGYASLAGLSAKLLDDGDGYLRVNQIESAIRGDDIHHPETSILCIENTHNVTGGVVKDSYHTKKNCDIAHSHGLKVHMDGARIFNAAAALDVDIKELVSEVDSVQFCLSKGLSAPVGSIIAGSEDFITRARKIRKKLGGGMRQAGVIAAPGIIALDKMVDRLEDDHKNADKLAEGLKEIGIDIDPDRFKTNIVLLDTSDIGLKAERFVDILEDDGILALSMGDYVTRFVTHRGINHEDIDRTLDIVEDIYN
ncbi:MAG: low-specificity L-threonine aldolase, partial [Candidatus Saliniplasma sp.]